MGANRYGKCYIKSIGSRIDNLNSLVEEAG